MLNEKDRQILRELRKDCRKSFAVIGRDIRIPISTVFDRVKFLENRFIVKHSALLDYNKLMHYLNVHYLISKAEESDALIMLPCVNSAFTTTKGIMLDCVFKDMSSMFLFEEMLSETYTDFVRIFIIEECKRECFSP